MGLVLGQLRQQRLQRQVHQAGEQREDRQQVEEPGPTEAPLQPDAFPHERHHVEVEVPVIDVVQRGQNQAAPFTEPVGLMDTHTGLGWNTSSYTAGRSRAPLAENVTYLHGRSHGEQVKVHVEGQDGQSNGWDVVQAHVEQLGCQEQQPQLGSPMSAPHSPRAGSGSTPLTWV